MAGVLVAVLRSRGEEDHRELRQGSVRADLPGYFVPAEFGHHHVQHRQSRSLFTNQAKRLFTVVGLDDFVSGPFESEGNEGEDVVVVISDEDPLDRMSIQPVPRSSNICIDAVP